jgi:hypothetical protein
MSENPHSPEDWRQVRKGRRAVTHTDERRVTPVRNQFQELSEHQEDPTTKSSTKKTNSRIHPTITTRQSPTTGITGKPISWKTTTPILAAMMEVPKTTTPTLDLSKALKALIPSHLSWRLSDSSAPNKLQSSAERKRTTPKS